MTSVRWGFVAFSTSMLLAIACGTGTREFATSVDGTANGGDSGTPNEQGGGNPTGTFQPDRPVEDAASTEEPNVDASACAADKQRGKLAPLDLVLMQDTSGSMWSFTSATTTKWSAIKDAVGAFMIDPASAGIGLGVQFFPLFENGVPNSCTSEAECGASGGSCVYKACSKTGVICASSADCFGINDKCKELKRCAGDLGTICQSTADCDALLTPNTCDQPIVRGICNGESISCNVPDYSTLAAPVAALPGAATAINTALNMRVPNGQTPTHAALQGAIQAAKLQKAAHPDAVVAVVLSTDGIPNTRGKCTDDTSAIAAVAAAANAGTPSIKTFVVGVLSPEDNTASAVSTLNAIAAAGGTTSATIIGATAATQGDFMAALQKVRTESLPCEFALPVPEAGTPDYDKVNVFYTDPTTKAQTLIKYVGSKANCDAANGGWYYDADPQTGGKPSKVVLCALTCGTVQKSSDAAVDVVQGCVTQKEVPSVPK